MRLGVGLLTSAFLCLGLSACGGGPSALTDDLSPARAAAVDTASLRAIVTTAGQPAAGATVQLMAADQTVAELVTDGAGTASDTDLPPGEYEVQVTGDGLDPTVTTTEVVAGSAAEVALEVGPATTGRAVNGRLTGRVMKTNGEPIAGARVVAWKPGTERAAETNAYGEFAIGDLPPGVYRVKGTKEGFLPLELPEIVVRAGETRFVKLVLRLKAGGGRIVGTVRTPGGEGLPGVRVSAVCGLGEAVVDTGSAGRYELVGLAPGTYKVQFSKLGFRTVLIERVVVRLGATVELNAVLEPLPGRIIGRVRTESGEPIGGARVVALRSGFERGATTNADGSYVLEVPGGEYLLRASKPGFLPAEARGVRVPAGGFVEKHFTLRRGG